MEKEFTFNTTREGSISNPKVEIYTKKEQELNKSEKDLLLGELIQKFEGFPTEVQHRFIQQIIDSTKSKG